MLICKALRDVAGKAEKAVAVCCVDCPTHAFGAGAFYNPIGDDIFQLLCFLVKRVTDIPEPAERIHDFQSLRAAFDAQNDLQADHATGPHPRHYIVCVSAVFCPTLAKCRPRGQLRPITHDSLADRQ